MNIPRMSLVRFRCGTCFTVDRICFNFEAVKTVPKKLAESLEGTWQDQRKGLHVEGMRLHEKIELLRRQQRLSDRALARMISKGDAVSDSTVRRWRKGIGHSPGFDMVIELARIFKVSVEYLANDKLDAPEEKSPTTEVEHLLFLAGRMGLDRAIARLAQFEDDPRMNSPLKAMPRRGIEIVGPEPDPPKARGKDRRKSG